MTEMNEYQTVVLQKQANSVALEHLRNFFALSGVPFPLVEFAQVVEREMRMHVAKISLNSDTAILSKPCSSKKFALQKCAISVFAYLARNDLLWYRPKNFACIEVGNTIESNINYKGMLQTYCQKFGIELPRYTTKNIASEDKPEFMAVCYFDGGFYPGSVSGRNKIVAEQHVAFEVLLANKGKTSDARGVKYTIPNTLYKDMVDENKCSYLNESFVFHEKYGALFAKTPGRDYIEEAVQQSQRDKAMTKIAQYNPIDKETISVILTEAVNNLGVIKEDALLAPAYQIHKIPVSLPYYCPVETDEPVLEMTDDEIREEIRAAKMLYKPKLHAYTPKMDYVVMLTHYAADTFGVLPQFTCVRCVVDHVVSYSVDLSVGAESIKLVSVGDDCVSAKNTAAYTFLKVGKFNKIPGALLGNEQVIDIAPHVPKELEFETWKRPIRVGLLPYELWYEIMMNVPRVTVCRALRVCRGFYSWFKSDFFWERKIDKVERDDYDAMQSDRVQVTGFELGRFFKAYDVGNRLMITNYYMQQISRQLSDKGLNFQVTMSEVVTCLVKEMTKVDHNGKTLPTIGYYMQVRYEGGGDRASCDLGNPHHHAAARTGGYVAERHFFPGMINSFWLSLPSASIVKRYIDRIAKCYGGAYELEYYVDPYTRMYAPLILIYIPFVKMLLEVGCNTY